MIHQPKMQILKRPHPLYHHLLNLKHPFTTATTTTTKLTTATTTKTYIPTPLTKLVLTTDDKTHLTQILHSKTHLTPPLVDKTIRQLWNHGPKCILLFNILDRHPTYKHTLSTYHLILDISTRLDLFGDAWGLVSRIRLRGLGPTPQTVNIFLQGYVSLGLPEKAIHIFLSMDRHFGIMPDLSYFNTLLDMLCKSKRVDLAVELMGLLKDRYKPDVISYNIIANGWCLIRWTNKALSVLKEMVESGIEPSLDSYNVILKGYFRTRQIKEASMFFKEMKRRKCEVDAVTYTILIHGFGVAGDIARARKLFDNMIGDGVLPTVATYNALIKVLCRNDNVKNAIGLYKEMLKKGYAPNRMTYNLLIRGVCHHGDPGKTEKLLQVMRKNGCEPNAHTFNGLIEYYCETGEIEKALEVYGKMGKEECLPNSNTYNVLIEAMFVREKSEDLVVAGRLLVEMIDRGFYPTEITFTRVLDGLLVTGNQSFAREILRLQSECSQVPLRIRLL